MSIEIKQLTLGIAQTNSYIIGDTDTKNAVLIDPVDNAPLLFETAQAEGWTIRKILATHAHFDHILAGKKLKEMTGAPFIIHKDCVPWLEQLPEQGRLFGLGEFPAAPIPDKLLSDKSELIEQDGIQLQTIYTPGHAPGHVSFYLSEQKILFSGDTLFAGSIGRTDLPGASYDVLMHSIMEKLIPLGDDVRVLPGHMQPTTIKKEKFSNPFLLSYDDADDWGRN